MPETMSIERRKVLQVLGADLVLTEGSLGMAGSISKAEEMVASDPSRFVLLQQFKNPANPEIHFRTTGPEIWDDTDGQVDVLVSGIGTGGTISGISRYIKKEKGHALLSVGVEPVNSAVITQRQADEAGSAQDPGDRRRIHTRYAGPFLGGPRGACQQRRVHRNGASFGQGRGHPVGNFLRSGSRRGGPFGQIAGICRKNDRHDTSGRRRTVSQHYAVRRYVRCLSVGRTLSLRGALWAGDSELLMSWNLW